MKKAGILIPLSSLPSDYGVGDMGAHSYQFIDMLEEAKVKIWQILPLNPVGFGNSPYQPYSSFAGDELYISLEELHKEGMLKELPPKFRENEVRVAYEEVRKYKGTFLRDAFVNFDPDEEYQTFISQEWVYLYAVYLTLKKKNDLRCWNEWPRLQKDWIKTASYDVSIYHHEIQYEMFVQYIFFKQWISLKEYANEKGIQVMGDIPFYVGVDSLDVWANQECFLLDEEGRPNFIAGVPPDYFSATGQRWGNPIYDWDYLKEDNYRFWQERIAYNSKLFDIIRIDHFRAFDTFWKIPVSCETAIEGEWVEAPGYEVVQMFQEKFPKVEIIAEDLGDLRPEVHKLKNHFGLKGMKIVEFTFDPNETNNNFDDVENMVIYTGTHDNQTINGWYLSQSEELQKDIFKKLESLGYGTGTIADRFVCYTLDSIADIAVLPLQDILGLEDDGRINTPGTLGTPNWEWKLVDFTETKDKMKFFKEAIISSGRGN